MGIGKKVNRWLIPFRLQIELLPKDCFKLAYYSDSSRPERPKYLNIGSLDFPHPLWHNLDNPTEMKEFARRQSGNIHIAHDLMSGNPIPVNDNSLSIVYCSHVIEHLRDEDVALMFTEIHRILAPGGTFRLVAPDMNLLYDAYQRGDDSLFDAGLIIYPCASIEQKLLLQFASALIQSHPENKQRKFRDDEIKEAIRTKSKDEFFDYFTKQVPLEIQKKYPADHMNWFSPVKALAMLQEAGFTKAWRSACMQSHLAVLRSRTFFDPYPDHSFYIECVKGE